MPEIVRKQRENDPAGARAAGVGSQAAGSGQQAAGKGSGDRGAARSGAADTATGKNPPPGPPVGSGAPSSDGREKLPPCARAALQYIEQGWQVVPCPILGRKGKDGTPDSNDGKAPLADKWQELRITAEEIHSGRYFGPGQNVGLILGDASRGLVDVDCDCQEAVRCAPLLLPLTPMAHGRPGIGVSHFWYQIARAKTEKFLDPEPPLDPSGELDDKGKPKKLKGTLIELRGNKSDGSSGLHTVAPPSFHCGSQTQIAWKAPILLTPEPVAYAALRTACARVAAVALIARRWHRGKRHELNVWLAGWWAKEGLDIEDAEHLAQCLCIAVIDQPADVNKTWQDIRSTYRKFNEQGPEAVAGYAKLAEQWGEPVMRALGKWLGFKPAMAAGDKRNSNARRGSGGAGDGGGKSKLGVNPVPYKLALAYGFDDPGNAAYLHGLITSKRFSPMVFCEALGGWLIWNAKLGVFELDERNEAPRRALAVCDMRHQDADRESDKPEPDLDRQALGWYWASTCKRQGARREEMLKVLSAVPGMSAVAEDFDHIQHQWRLATPGATLDLTHAGLRALLDPESDTYGQPPPPDPAYRLTKITRARFNIEAQCPVWEAHLQRIFDGNADMIGFMQRFLGYCLFGGNPEQVLAIFYGEGSNGKGKLINAVAHCLGDYAQSIHKDALIARENMGNNQLYALAAVRGARFASLSESGKRRRMDEETVKTLVGEDKIMARLSHKDFFEYQPQFTPILITNHKPRVEGTDEGIWRRLLVVPFTVQIPKEQRDQRMDEKLQAEADGILRWMLTGLLMWHEMRDRHGHGLHPPAEVQYATAAYREDSDPIGTFFDDCCDVGVPHFEITKGRLYDAYEAWAKEAGLWYLAKKDFGPRVELLPGVDERRTGTQRFWTGIDLKQGIAADLGLDAQPRTGRLKHETE